MTLESSWRRVVIPVCFVAVVAFVGMAFADTRQLWYQSLMKPAIMPPDAVFSYVWGAIYILIAVSAVLVLSSGDEALIKDAYYYYGLNGALNALWTYLFFERHRMVASLICLIALIFSTMHLMRRVDKGSGITTFVLLPYLLWLIFSLALNYAIAMLN